jgi:hypothetical protein
LAGTKAGRRASFQARPAANQLVTAWPVHAGVPAFRDSAEKRKQDVSADTTPSSPQAEIL